MKIDIGLFIFALYIICGGSPAHAEKSDTKFFYFDQIIKLEECQAAANSMNQGFLAFDSIHNLPADTFAVKPVFYGPYSRRKSVCSVSVKVATPNFKTFRGKLSSHTGDARFKECDEDAVRLKNDSTVIWPYISTGVFSLSCRTDFIGVVAK